MSDFINFPCFSGTTDITNLRNMNGATIDLHNSKFLGVSSEFIRTTINYQSVYDIQVQEGKLLHNAAKIVEESDRLYKELRPSISVIVGNFNGSLGIPLLESHSISLIGGSIISDFTYLYEYTDEVWETSILMDYDNDYTYICFRRKLKDDKTIGKIIGLRGPVNTSYITYGIAKLHMKGYLNYSGNADKRLDNNFEIIDRIL